MVAKKDAQLKEPTFEERVTRLQNVVTRLENPDLPLEESVTLYKEGLILSRVCREQIEKARQEVRQLTAEGRWEPFAEGQGEDLNTSGVSFGSTGSKALAPDEALPF